MDELSKLLENAGVPDGGIRDNSPEEDVLNDLSSIYQFEINGDGSISVFAEYEGEGWRQTSRYESFDQMLKMHGHQ